MPGGTTPQEGNVKLQNVLGFAASAISYPTVTANTSATQTYTIPGLLIGDIVDIQLQGHVAGLSVSSAWCAAAGTLTIQWVNSTTGTITGAAFTSPVIMLISRYENANVAQIGASPWLQAIV